MKIAIASDHAGFPLKEHLVAYLRGTDHDVIDLGVETDAVRSDYADAAKSVGAAVTTGDADRGLLICGSGVGASIAANKIAGVYCAICHDTYSAAQGVQHDNMNVLALGARVIGQATAESLVDAFISAKFDTDTDRYVRRFQQVRSMENSDY